jgi:hypothetical protein
MRTNVLVLCEEAYDLATSYGACFMKKLAEEAKAIGKTVVETDGDVATMDSAIAQYDPAVFYAVGHGQCYSEDTEILTENGWKRFYELVPGERVATLNPKTDELEYQVPVAYQKYWYSGKMLSIEGRRVSLLVTPDHRLYMSFPRSTGWSPYRMVMAKDIGEPSIRKFKRGAIWNCQAMEYFQLPSVELEYTISRQAMAKKVNIEDWLRFFGVWLAEGSASLGDRKGTYIISITQNDDEKRRVIKEWVDRVGEQVGFKAWEEATNKHSKCIKFKNKQIYEYLKQFGYARDKFIPKEIKMLPPHLLRILLEAMMFGDGNIDWWGKWRYSTASKRLADDVQEIAMKLNMGATISYNKTTGVYTVNITEGETMVSGRSIAWVDYEGFVYCVTTPNGIIYVRRNGKPVWCGNCCIFTAKGAVPYIEVAGYNCDVHFACAHFRYSCTRNLRLEKFVGRHVHLLSCVTGLNLGPELVRRGARSFIGYKNLFVVGVKVSGSWPAPCTPPSQYVDCYSFCDSDCEGERVIVRGGSVGEAMNAMRRKFQEYIDKYTRGEWKDWPVAYWASMFLQHNLDNLVAYGDMNFRPCSEAVPLWMAVAPAAVLAIPIGAVVAEEGRKAKLW